MKNDVFTSICSLTGASVSSVRHKSGATLILHTSDTRLPYVSVTFPFGGAAYGIRQGKKYIPSPPGAAHFAEHMLFNKEGVNERFSLLGADVNAVTSLSETCYYLTARKNFFESLHELLGMVLLPSFPEETFEKERQIILRELEEEHGDVFVLGRNALAGLLFSRSPLRRDVGGSARDVKALTFDALCETVDAVYRPESAVISVVGPFSLEEVQREVFSFLDGLSSVSAARLGVSPSIHKDTPPISSFRANTDTPMFFAALSPSVTSLGRGKAEDYLFCTLLEDMLFDRSEPFFQYFSEECAKEGIEVFGDFDSQTELFGDSAMISVSLPVSSPKGAAEVFGRLYSSLYKSGKLFSAEHFESKRRGLIADYLSLLDSPADICFSLGEYACAGGSLFDEARYLGGLTKDSFLSQAYEALASSRPVFACGSKQGKTC